MTSLLNPLLVKTKQANSVGNLVHRTGSLSENRWDKLRKQIWQRLYLTSLCASMQVNFTLFSLMASHCGTRQLPAFLVVSWQLYGSLLTSFLLGLREL